MIYFDSNIFIYALIYEENSKKVKKADYYLTKLVKGDNGMYLYFDMG